MNAAAPTNPEVRKAFDMTQWAPDYADKQLVLINDSDQPVQFVEWTVAPAVEELFQPKALRDDELRIIDVTNHAHIFGHHRGAYYFEKIIEKAMEAKDIWVGTRSQIADHVLARNAR